MIYHTHKLQRWNVTFLRGRGIICLSHLPSFILDRPLPPTLIQVPSHPSSVSSINHLHKNHCLRICFGETWPNTGQLEIKNDDYPLKPRFVIYSGKLPVYINTSPPTRSFMKMIGINILQKHPNTIMLENRKQSYQWTRKFKQTLEAKKTGGMELMGKTEQENRSQDSRSESNQS